MRLEPELAQALTNLRNHPDFQIFLRALADDGEKLMEKLVMIPSDSEVNVIRGQARQVHLLLHVITEAPKELERHKTNDQRGQH